MTETTFTPQEIVGLMNALEKVFEQCDYDLDKMSRILLTDAESLYNKVGAIFNKNNGW